jgi:cold shock CspA family protein
MPQGTIKEYHPASHTGSLLLDDGSEITIDAISARDSGLRFLRIGQRVKFDIAEEDGARLARRLRILTID